MAKPRRPAGPRRGRFELHALGLALACALPLTALADDASAGQARALEERLRAPCCRAQMLSGHESPAARGLREEIATRLRGGTDATSIERDLVARYGASIVAIPLDRDPRGGLSLALIALLAASALALGAAGVRWVRRSATPASGPSLPSEPEDAAALDARLDAELHELER